MTAVETRATRWGDVDIRSERLDDTYTRCTYSGPRQAVVVEVGNRLQRTTHCYEHMFVIDHMLPHSKNAAHGWIEVQCTSSNYAGD